MGPKLVISSLWLVVEATLVVLIASHAYGIRDGGMAGQRVTSTANGGSGFRLELTHVDSMMDAETLKSPERLKHAVDRSRVRSHNLAGRTRDTTKASAANQSSALPAGSPAPVFSSNGAYIVQLSLGTPPQEFIAILDTGSDLVWRQSSPCVECFKQEDPYFDPASSSTYKTVSCSDDMCAALPMPGCSKGGCEYYYSYGDGSTTIGELSSDTLTIGGASAKNFVFGAGEDNYGNLGTVGCDGLVGMGGGPLSLPSQMAKTIGSKFSYCLVAWTDAPAKTSPLLFGTAANLNGSAVKSTPFASSAGSPAGDTFYYLTLTGISVGATLLDIPKGTFDLQPDGSGGFIIDSGTTVTILVPSAYNPIRAAYAAAIDLPPKDGSSVGLDLCYDSSKASSLVIPNLTFHLAGADFEIPPDNVFLDYQDLLCLAFLGMDSGINIFGNVQQQNFHISYDKGSKNQLSFQPITCDTL